MLDQKKCVFNMCLCNKVPYILMKSSYYYLFSICFWICVCLHILCIKAYKKTRVEETHRNNKTRFDHENHEIQKAMDQEPCSPKLDRNGPERGPLGILHGPTGPSQCYLTSSSTVRFEPNTLYFYMFHFLF